MANKNTRARTAAERKEKKHFHGKACETAFWVVKGGQQVRNPNTKRKSPWRGGSAANKKAARRPEMAA